MLALYIAIGGALGALARYALTGWVHSLAGASFPWGTLAVNLTGSMVLALAARLLTETATDPELRAFVAIGFLGSFTTFSTFSYEALALLQEGEWHLAGLYVAWSVGGGLLGALLGFGLAGTILE